MKRERKVNLDKLTKKQVDDISVKIGAKITTILNKAIKECNELANIYGLQVKIGYEIEPKDK